MSFLCDFWILLVLKNQIILRFLQARQMQCKRHLGYQPVEHLVNHKQALAE